MKIRTKTKDRIMSVVITLTLAVSVMLTGFATPTAGAADGEVSGGDLATQIIIARFDALDEDVEWQGYDPGEIASADELKLPNLLIGEDKDGEALTIGGVTWECTAIGSDPDAEAPAFDPNITDRYEFTAVLPQGYKPAQGVSLPVISVFIRGGIMALAAAGAFDITGGTLGTHYTYTANTLTITADGTYTIAMATAGATTTTDRIAVQSGLTNVNITLNGVSIDVSGINEACAFDMTGATVNLTLTGSNTLKSGLGRPGLAVPKQVAAGGEVLFNSTLTITAASTGSLTAVGGGNGAGIGDGAYNGYYDFGTVNINGGTVHAQGGNFGAGIGTVSDAPVGGIVNISGGKVTATGGGSAAGIGGGHTSVGCTVNISGGTVVASGGHSGPGIGRGGNSLAVTSRGTLTITGGSVLRNSHSAGGANNEATAANNSVPVYRVRLQGLPAEAKITAISTSTAYGFNDVFTDSGGSAYFWLPAGDTLINVTIGGAQYVGSLTMQTNDGNTVTLALLSGVVPVTNITGIPANMSTGTITLNAMVSPSTATFKTIVWSVADAGTTGAAINGSSLTTTNPGDLTIRATIYYGGAGASHYTQDFNITVDAGLTVTGGTIGTDYTYTGGLLTILTGTAMTVSGSTVDHRIVIGSGVTANLTFDGVSIDMTEKSGATPVFIPSGATLGLTLTGSNSLTGAAWASDSTAGLGVPGGATLTITAGSTGSLSAYGGTNGAGIGGGLGGGCGTVTINGGTVYAQGGAGAGIGGGRQGAGGAVTVTGGSVTANGGEYSAGIGGTINGGGNGTLTITGGSVKRSGGSAYEANAKDGEGTDVYLVTFTVGNPPVINTAITAFNNTQYGINGVKTDGGGKLYFWLPQSAVGAVEVMAGSVYIGGFTPKPDNSEAVTLIKESDFVPATDITNPTNSINIGRTVNLQATVVPTGATFQTIIWTMTDDGGTGATLSESGALSVPANGSTGTISVTATVKQSPYGTDISANFTIMVVDRDLKINGGVEGTDYIYAAGVLTIRTSEPMTITGTTINDRIVINSGVTANLTFDGVNINLSGTPSSNETHAPVYLNANAKLALILIGNNKLIGRNSTDNSKDTAGLGVPSGTTLTVTAESTGSLEAKGGADGAGIGGGYEESCGTIYIQGGTITSSSTYRGAGIGGGYWWGDGGTVNISGGTVTAYSNEGAGIGGGYNRNGGTVNISGGTVTAYSSDAAAIGGGIGGNGGAVTISGGTVTAYSDWGVAIGRGAGSATTDGSLTVTGEFDYKYNTVATPPNGSSSNGTFNGQPAWWNNNIKYIWLESLGAPQTITFPNSTVDKTYGDAPFTIVATRSVGSGAVTYASNNASVATVDETTGTVTIAGVGTTTITATAAAVPGTWTAASASYDLTVTAKGITVAAGNYTVTKVYNGTDSAGTGSGKLSISGVVGSDTVTVTPAPQAFSGSNVGNYTVTVGLTLGGADAGKYTLASNTVDVSGKITPVQLTWNNNGTVFNKTYDGTTAASVSNQPSLIGVVGSEQVSRNSNASSLNFASADAGTHEIIVSGYGVSYVYPANSSNYKAPAEQPEFQKGTINKAPAPTPGTPAMNARINNDTNYTLANLLPNLPTGQSYGTVSYSIGTITGANAAKTAATESPAGTLKVTLTDAAIGQTSVIPITVTSDNFNNFVVNLTVNAVDKTDVSSNITFNPTSVTYNGLEHSPQGATITWPAGFTQGAGGGWTYTYSLETGDTGTLSAGGKPQGAGTYTVTAAYGDGDNTGSKTAAFTINPLNVSGGTVSAFGAMTYDGTPQTPTATVTVNGLTATGTWSAVTNVGDTTTFTASGNFTGTIAGRNPNMTRATLTWSANGTVHNKTFDGTDIATVDTAPTLNGILGGDDVTTSVGTVTFSDANAGTAKTVTAAGYGITGTHAGNYSAPTAQPVLANADIDKANAATAGFTATNPPNYMISAANTSVQTFNLSTIALSKTNHGSLGYALVPGTFTDNDSILTAAPTLSGSILSFTGNGKTAGTATQSITITSQNYTDITVSVTFEATLKVDVAIGGLTAQNGTYNGKPHRGVSGTATSGAYTGTLDYSYAGTGITGTTAAQPVNAGNYTLTVSVPGGNAEFIGSTAFTFSIAQAPLTVTANDKAAALGDPLPTFTYTVTGMVNNETAETAIPAATAPSVSSPTANMDLVGNYPIVVTGGTASANYEITGRVGGNLTVNPKSTPPTITTTSLPDGTVGTAYSQTIGASGTSPITWALQSGSLPGGLTLSGNTISGTPEAAGTFHFTVAATNTGGSASQPLSITINSAPSSNTNTTYAITAGEDSTWKIGSGLDLTIICNGDYSKFIELRIGGKVVGTAHYTKAEGSTIITLKAGYLETLPAGTHKVELVFDSQTVETLLTIHGADPATQNKPASSPAPEPESGTETNPGLTSPKTGDESITKPFPKVTAAIVFGMATAAVSGYYLAIRKRRRYNSRKV